MRLYTFGDIPTTPIGEYPSKWRSMLKSEVAPAATVFLGPYSFIYNKLLLLLFCSVRGVLALTGVFGKPRILGMIRGNKAKKPRFGPKTPKMRSKNPLSVVFAHSWGTFASFWGVLPAFLSGTYSCLIPTRGYIFLWDHDEKKRERGQYTGRPEY